MRGVILAGGTGSRLRPLSELMPKQMVPIGTVPVLEWGIKTLRRSGVDQLAIVYNPEFDHIQRYFGDGSDYGVEITYLPQPEPRGLADAVRLAEEFVSAEPFVVLLGDNYFQTDLTCLLERFNATDHKAAVGMQAVADPERYGVVVPSSDGTVVDLVEKPDDPPTNHALVGAYVFNSQVFDAIAQIEPSDRGELELTDALRWLLSNGGSVAAVEIPGYWQDVGTPDDVLAANHHVLDELNDHRGGKVENGATVTGTVRVHEGATVKSGAVVRGPATIAADAYIGGATEVGPYVSVGPSASVKQATIKKSVLMKNVAISTAHQITDAIFLPGASLASDGEIAGSRVIIPPKSHTRLQE